MAEFKITIGLPEQDYPDLKKRAESFFHDNLMKAQREFFESCTTGELGTLFLCQEEKSSPLSMIKRILTERYKDELSDKGKYLHTVEQFLMAHYSMVDNEGKLAEFKQSCLAKHFATKTLDELANTYSKLLSDIVMDSDERQHLVTKGMTKIIIEKLDENTSVYVLNKFLNADAENTELENFIKEKFQLARA